MANDLDDLITLLHRYGQRVDAEKPIVEVNSAACIDTSVPDSAGAYWIETTMPIEEMRRAITELLGKEKKARSKPPKGTSLIKQELD